MNSRKTENVEEISNEIKQIRINLFNKVILGFFLVLVSGILISNFIEAAMLDLGYGIDGSPFPRFWLDSEVLERSRIDPRIMNQLIRHPNFFWQFTQFTWLTTIMILLFLIIRFFKFEDSVPNWLNWIMSQRFLVLIASFDAIVGIVFWASLANSMAASFAGPLYKFQFSNTVLVHAVLPIAINIYSMIFQIKDKKASLLRVSFIFKGMIYPIIYFAYYFLIANIWDDPYPITSLASEPLQILYILPIACIGIYIILGLVLIFYNWLLLKFNRHYDVEKDHYVITTEKNKIEKIRKKIIRKHLRDWRNADDDYILD